MSHYLRALLIPLIAIPVTAILIVGIGSLLLAVGHVAAVPVALGLAAAALAAGAVIARRDGAGAK